MECSMMEPLRLEWIGEKAESRELNPCMPALALIFPTLRETRNIPPQWSPVPASPDSYDPASNVIVVDDANGEEIPFRVQFDLIDLALRTGDQERAEGCD
jgi:hypothetical protein